MYVINTNTLGISQYAGPAWIGVTEIDGKTLLLRADGLLDLTNEPPPWSRSPSRACITTTH